MPRRTNSITRTKSADEPKRSTIRFTCTRFNSSAFCENANPDEDWTKIPDLAERRRIQNRIAQRNYRKKLKQRLEEQSDAESGDESSRQRKSTSREAPRSQPMPQRDLQWHHQRTTSTISSPSISEAGSYFEAGSVFGGRSSYSPPAFSDDGDSVYGSYRTHASSVTPQSPFSVDDLSFPMDNEKPFGNELSTDWSSPFDNSFSFDNNNWSESFDNQNLFDSFSPYPQDMSPFLTPADTQHGSLKSHADPIMGFSLDAQPADLFSQQWTAS